MVTRILHVPVPPYKSHLKSVFQAWCSYLENDERLLEVIHSKALLYGCTAALDIPVQDDIPSLNPSTAVKHAVDDSRNLWIKSVDLELCDRSSLSSLMANINFLRKLSSVNQPHRLDDSRGEHEVPPNSSIYLSLPVDIRLQNSQMMLAYPLCTLGSALDLCDGYPQGLPEPIVAAIISRAVQCMEQLHAHGVLHRAICAHHLLLTENEKNHEIQVRLCGLGSVAQFPPTGYQMGRNDLPPVDFSWQGWRCTSINDESEKSHPMAWNAPELIAQDFTGYSWPADVYSLGLTIAELYTGQTPYACAEPSLIVLKKLCGTEILELNMPNREETSQDMLQVYYACLERSPNRRPSAQGLLQMPWIRNALEKPFDRSMLDLE